MRPEPVQIQPVGEDTDLGSVDADTRDQEIPGKSADRDDRMRLAKRRAASPAPPAAEESGPKPEWNGRAAKRAF